MEGLQQQCTDTFAGNITIGSLIKHPATGMRREHVHRRQCHEMCLVNDEIDAADNGHATLSAANGFTGQMDGGE